MSLVVSVESSSRELIGRRELEEERERSGVRELTALAEAAERERISRELHDRVAHTMGVTHRLCCSLLPSPTPLLSAREKLHLARETTRAGGYRCPD